MFDQNVCSLLQVSVAVGCAARDRNVVFASTFATFFTRAFDQLRMAAISESNINLCGSHCGISIGQCYIRTMSKLEVTFRFCAEVFTNSCSEIFTIVYLIS